MTMDAHRWPCRRWGQRAERGRATKDGNGDQLHDSEVKQGTWSLDYE
eukprot:CAMPEP_0203947892 /NCGR_PEP_ID=MMETSP0359-20131031/82713_1 /ASSEMBLY_ACC=CAM_ASM_000338 /TAXON_ID=268821 /ORGANISM="Scrippsiella Hangoei, Strain SHTV-5" /LENGTH=46 /DNA_ID= /DNA_START= /DNA_END= /DNA_ORIENTATION=